jgi:hypothetical protein
VKTARIPRYERSDCVLATDALLQSEATLALKGLERPAKGIKLAVGSISYPIPSPVSPLHGSNHVGNIVLFALPVSVAGTRHIGIRGTIARFTTSLDNSCFGNIWHFILL